MIGREEIEVFSGHMTATEAYLYVRAPALGGGGSWKLTGSLRGPYASNSHTLPLEVELEDLGAGPSLLARAVMPDPCFWSLQSPTLYRLSVDLRDEGEVAENTTLDIGFRFLGAAGSYLRWENRRWVMRAVAGADFAEQQSVDHLAEARQESATLIVREPGVEFCRQADQLGVLLVADLRLVEANRLVSEVRSLAHHPAVFTVILPDSDVSEKQLRAASGNLLLAQYVAADQHSRLANWAHLVVAEMQNPEEFAAACEGCPVPVVAYAQDGETLSIAEARRRCDVLQRRLAPHGDLAGYAVEVASPPSNEPS